MSEPIYVRDDWRIKIKGSPLWKRAAYKVIRPAISLAAQRHLGPEYRHDALRFVIGQRGFPFEHRRQWVDSRRRIRGSRLLIQGTGTGWDVAGWAKYRPETILAVDLFPFEEWPEVARHVRERYGVPVTFAQASLNNLPLRNGSIDIVASDAVYEHCQDLPSVMSESRRVLNSTGLVYASYGPLWSCAGGDHFSGRGGLEHLYSHIQLSPQDYHRYFEAHLRTVEDFQSGGRYVELDLFSKLTTRQYFEAYQESRLQLVDLVLEVSSDALTFRRAYPAAFSAMINSEYTTDDLLIKAHYIILYPTK